MPGVEIHCAGDGQSEYLLQGFDRCFGLFAEIASNLYRLNGGIVCAYYGEMKRLIDYYTSLATNDIMPGSSYSVLSDWGQETAGVSPMVPGEFTITTTYYHLLRAMAEIAGELGHEADARAFSARADRTRAAFNRQFCKNGVYGNGQQSEFAMPLYYGLVDEADEADVARRLAERVKSDDYKIKTGEIALKPLFMSLAKHGYNDIVYQMANQTDCPSYGYWVKQGHTTTPEYWDVGAFSQNHCMMDHIEEWFFSQLGGISNAGYGFDTVRVAPWIPDDMTRLDASTQSVYGTIRCSYERTADERTDYTIEIPANSCARVALPCAEGQAVSENGASVAAGADGVAEVAYADGEARLLLGSGTYRLTVGPGEANGIDAAGADAATGASGGADATYTLSGIRVAHAVPGINIVNGRKVMF